MLDGRIKAIENVVKIEYPDGRITTHTTREWVPRAVFSSQRKARGRTMTIQCLQVPPRFPKAGQVEALADQLCGQISYPPCKPARGRGKGSKKTGTGKPGRPKVSPVPAAHTVSQENTSPGAMPDTPRPTAIMEVVLPNRPAGNPTVTAATTPPNPPEPVMTSTEKPHSERSNSSSSSSSSYSDDSSSSSSSEEERKKTFTKTWRKCSGRISGSDSE